jgi:hypothetical protein
MATECGKCILGEEPREDRRSCFLPDRWQLLKLMWRLFLPVDILLVLVVVGLKAYMMYTGKTLGVFGEPIRWLSRCPSSVHAGWMYAVVLWDFVDISFFLWWFVDAKPEEGKGDEFEQDWIVAYICCGTIWIGPALPILSLILPRRRYVQMQVVVDGVEVFLVYYTSTLYSFTTKGKVIAGLNYLTTFIDCMIWKGPDFLTQLCESELWEEPEDEAAEEVLDAETAAGDDSAAHPGRSYSLLRTQPGSPPAKTI